MNTMMTFKGFMEDDALWKKCVMILFFSLSLALLGSVIAIATIRLYDMSPSETSAKYLLQGFSALGMFILAPLFLAYLFSTSVRRFLALSKFDWRILGLGVLIIVASIPLMNFIGAWNEGIHLPESLRAIEEAMRSMEDKNNSVSEEFLDQVSIAGFLCNTLILTILPAIGEEFLFRGVIQTTLGKHWKNEHIAVWSTALLFSAIHLQFYGFFPRMIMGALLGYLLVWSRSIWVPILCHFLNNFIIVLSNQIGIDESNKLNPESIGTESPFIVALSLIVCAILLFALLQIRNRQTDSKTTCQSDS